MEGLFTLLGVVLGAGITYLVDRRSWKRQIGLETALVVAETYTHIWGNQPRQNLVIHIEKVKTRLAALKVDSATITAFEVAARQCWQHSWEDWDQGNGGDEALHSFSQRIVRFWTPLRRRYPEPWTLQSHDDETSGRSVGGHLATIPFE